MTNRESQYKAVHEEAFDLFKRKNSDYGDAFATYGVMGVLIRMGDKISRAVSVDKKGLTLVDDETMRDTLMDLHNYSAMAIMLMDEYSSSSEEKEDTVDEENVKI